MVRELERRHSEALQAFRCCSLLIIGALLKEFLGIALAVVRVVTGCGMYAVRISLLENGPRGEGEGEGEVHG